MNITHYLISALFTLLLLTGCAIDPATATLDRAETLMEEHPDSALAMLDTLQPPTSAEENARYALLYSQALDKNYIDIADDSLILIAVNHYEKSGDIYRLMLSHYYHARVLYNKESFPRSLLVHHKSLRYAEQLGNYFWCGRNADQIFGIYEMFYHCSDALNYAKLAFDYFNKSEKQTIFNSYAVLGLARAYYNSDKYDEALILALGAADSAKKYDDRSMYLSAKKISSECYYFLNLPDSAIKGYSELLTHEYDPDLIGLIGLTYLKSDNPNKAYEMTLDTITALTPNLVTFKSSIYKSRNDFKSALSLIENIMLKNDSTLISYLNQGFSSELSDYYEYEDKIKELEFANLKMTYGITISLIVIAISCIGFIVIKMLIRKNRIIERNVNIAQNFNEILISKEAKSKQDQEKILDLLTSKFKMIDSLCSSYYESSATKSIKRKISDEVESIIQDLMSEERLTELENSLNLNDSNIVASLREDLPQLKELDYKLFIYSAFGFSNSAIALFLKEDKIESIYNRKARLKTKIKKLNSAQQEKYLRHLSH
ncbi:hypothetical protein E4T81_08890 [Barnesiella sp. WM24]|uniref:hypothetical protein n=1 Tax=Barnesiella sp. WM24 TaxID=2558278 RepID=UPI001072C0B4|nr:hypothetical protein [Barnesiella sp. WM24]TFU93070.1 hypothetical protein E4T81_08890 [Barnesiella sp. WM24]